MSLFSEWMLCGLALLAATESVAGAGVTVGRLRCEYRRDPVGIDIARPRLSWVLDAGNVRGERQTAYRIIVGSTPEKVARGAGDLWDSGKVASGRSIHVDYAGKALRAGQPCWWRVRVWDAAGKAAAWSPVATWAMGPLSRDDWQASWIGYDAAYDALAEQAKTDAALRLDGLKWVRLPEKQNRPGATTLFRRVVEIPADRKVSRAVLALYADNSAEAVVNGKTVGSAFRWDRAAHLDVADSLRAGPNVIALRAAQSDLLPPCALGKLVVRFAEGDDLVVPVDGTWKATQEAAAGYEQAGFDDSGWTPAEAFDGTPWRGPAPVADVDRVPVPYLRKDFSVEQPVKRAVLYATALGAYEMRLNGKPVGDAVLTPGWSEFKKRVYYQAYDVTRQVLSGRNTLGAMLGDGWYASVLAHLGHRMVYGGRPRLLAELVIERADGSRQVIGTDGTWQASYGPLLHADLLMGCEYDARQEMPGWDAPGFNAASWHPVLDAGWQPAEKIAVQAAVAEPSRPLETLPARKLTEPKPGCWTFDLGQNMVGWVRLKVRGAAGQRITVRHGEMLNPDGTIYAANLRSCPGTDFFILSGNGVENLEPRFTFHGFRYVEIRGLAEKPALDAVTGVVVHTDMERTGQFECSSKLLNQLYSNIIWGNKGNYLEVPTDCPQRDERMGWTGDTEFFAPTAAYNFGVAPFFTRWLQICEDDQFADGSLPHVVPDIMNAGGATAWGDAGLLCTYDLYRAYGDTHVVAARYAMMERYMQWLGGKVQEDGLTHVGGFGDWLNLGGGADGVAIDTAFHAHLAHLMSEMAAAIGRKEDAERYQGLFEKTRAAFVARYLQPDGSLKDCSQTGYALAYTMGLLSDAQAAQAAPKFVGEIERFDSHLATGFIGTPRLLPALNAAGRNDVAYKLLLQESYPSWLYQVTLGATTMWERWNGWTPEHGFGDISMNSYNHYAFGAVGEYLYGGVGGIQPAAPGYREIAIRPAVEPGLDWAKTSLMSPYGLIATSWRLADGQLSLEVTIPANTTATIAVPTSDPAGVTEGGKPAAKAAGVKSLGPRAGAALFQVGSGTYRFSARR